MEKIYVVTGATGNIGSLLTQTLLAQGHRVRAVGRSEERLKSLVEQGAEGFVGSLEDSEFLTEAFGEATALFAMIPPNYGAPDFRGYQNRVAAALERAVANSGVMRVVTLSSIGAHLAEGTGPIKGLHDFEERFNRLEGVGVVHLRPTFFMENLLFGLDVIKNMGINGSALKADVPLPMIATKDIAAAASQVLQEGITGKSTRELLGPRDYTMAEATQVLGRAIGREDLKYVQFPYENVREAMLGQGLSVSVVEAMLEMYRGMNEGNFQATEARGPRNTTTTTLEEFAKTFAQAYNRSAAASAG